ncbi:MAG: hypothetical protein GYB32_09780 [Algicola sp.]|nr:hypothetical protein [Algicola sp.]
MCTISGFLGYVTGIMIIGNKYKSQCHKDHKKETYNILVGTIHSEICVKDGAIVELHDVSD